MKKLLLGVAALFAATSIFAAEPVDPASYVSVPGADGGNYTLTNLWMKAHANDNNLNSDPNLGGAGEVRGMAVKDGKMLFAYRTAGAANGMPGVKIFDLVTGNFDRAIMKDTLDFQTAAGKNLGYPCNDIQVDDAGNVILFNMTTNWTTSPAALYTINLETGALTKIFELADDFLGYEANGAIVGYRVDYFAVKGDVTKDAQLLFPCSGSAHVVRCDIKDGALVAQQSGDMYKDITIQGYYPATAVDNGTAPRAVIVDDDYFYLDGFNSFATLYDNSGSIVESVGNAPEDCAPTAKTGNNGVAEFTLNGKPFSIYVISNNEVTPAQGFKLVEMGAGPTFAGAKCYWTVPESGLGAISNAYRTALPRIQYVNDKEVYLSLYACGAGAAAYKVAFTGGSSVNNTSDDFVNIVVNGNDITFSVNADAELYNIAGQKVAEVNAASSIKAPANGLYIVKAKVNGAEKIQKVSVQ